MQFAEAQNTHEPAQWLPLLGRFHAPDPFVTQVRDLHLIGQQSLGLARQLPVPTVIAQLRKGHYRPITNIDLAQ